MLFRTKPTTLLLIYCQLMLNFQIIFKSRVGADNIFKAKVFLNFILKVYTEPYP